jgi:hypothetical protein
MLSWRGQEQLYPFFSCCLASIFKASQKCCHHGKLWTGLQIIPAPVQLISSLYQTIFPEGINFWAALSCRSTLPTSPSSESLHWVLPKLVWLWLYYGLVSKPLKRLPYCQAKKSIIQYIKQAAMYSCLAGMPSGSGEIIIIIIIIIIIYCNWVFTRWQ